MNHIHYANRIPNIIYDIIRAIDSRERMAILLRLREGDADIEDLRLSLGFEDTYLYKQLKVLMEGLLVTKYLDGDVEKYRLTQIGYNVLETLPLFIKLKREG